MSLTKSDFDEFRNLMKLVIDEKLKIELDERLKYLPTKEEFYKEMDKIMKELETIRIEQKATAQILARHTDEIESLQKIHPGNKHISTI